MAATHQLKIGDLFSVKEHVCVVTGGGTGICLQHSHVVVSNMLSTITRHWLDGHSSSRRKWSVTFPRSGSITHQLSHIVSGAKVYITGRRQEVLENTANTHSPDDAGQIIP